jgi:uncharacterized protein YchJ
MTTKEFWSIYTNKKDILHKYDIIYDFFSNELPTEFVEEYNVNEVILEMRGHHETAKEFEKVLKFSDLIQKKHPDLYQGIFQYFDDFLVDFHCFHKNGAEAAKAFENFVKNPVADYDKFLTALNKLIFYQHVKLVDEAITRTYDIVEDSPKVIPGSEFELAMPKLNINLEHFYNQADSAANFNRSEFFESLKPYKFNFDDYPIENGLFTNPSEHGITTDMFIRDRQNTLIFIERIFIKEMKNSGFSFVLSSVFWRRMLYFWEKQADSKQLPPNVFFKIPRRDFDNYLNYLAGDYFIDNRAETFALLWGSVYIYDFLKSINLIEQSLYDSFKETSKILKGRYIAISLSSLWNYNFVHQWTKPDSVSELECNEEEKIFLKSYTMKHLDFSKLKGEIAGELSTIGELSEYIIRGSKNDYLFSENNKSKTTYNPFEKKVGRNEPCPCGSGKKYKQCCGK